MIITFVITKLDISLQEKLKNRNAFLEKLKVLSDNINEMKTKDNQKKTIRKLEKELEKVEKCYMTTHGELMDEYPKILARFMPEFSSKHFVYF